MTKHSTFEAAEAAGGHVIYDSKRGCYWTTRSERAAYLISSRNGCFLADGWKDEIEKTKGDGEGMELSEINVGEVAAQVTTNAYPLWKYAVAIISAAVAGLVGMAAWLRSGGR